MSGFLNWGLNPWRAARARKPSRTGCGSHMARPYAQEPRPFHMGCRYSQEPRPFHMGRRYAQEPRPFHMARRYA